MGKTETMLLKNKEANAAKVETAVSCIKDMLLKPNGAHA